MKNWFQKLPFALVRIGKENKWLKYPILCLLSILFAICNLCDAVKTHVYSKMHHKMMALVLAFCMFFSLMPTTVLAAEQTEDVKAVLSLINALSTVDELAAQDTEDEDFMAYLETLRTDVLAARTAYFALFTEEKAALDVVTLAKLTALEKFFAAMPAIYRKRDM